MSPRSVLADKRRFGWWEYPAAVLVLGLLSLAMLGWTDQLGQRLRVNQFSSDTLQDARTRTATGHLWLEEGLTDGDEAKLQRATADFAEAARLSRVMADGGLSAHGGPVRPLVAPVLHRRVEDLTGLLDELTLGVREKITRRAGPGSALDMRFNARFEEFQRRADDLEKILEDNQAADHAKSRRLFSGMLAAWSIILGSSVLGLLRREHRRRQAEEALRTSEERLTAIVASAMDAIVAVDEARRIVLFNAAAEQMFECPASEAMGTPIDRFIPERLCLGPDGLIAGEAGAGGPGHTAGVPRRLSGRRASGEEFPLEATISRARTRGQRLWTVILRDITQRERAEEVARLYATTREREELRMEFFANISHELRTPLALILGPVWKTLEAGELTEDTRRDLEVVERNARLLLRHVNDLLDLAKIDAGRLGPTYAEVDLAQLARLTASHFRALAAERDITYVEDTPESLVAEVDAPQVERIMLNLLSNAFKFTPAGGRVRVGLCRDGAHAALEVEDTGPGVPSHLRQAIFERFRQVERGSARRFGGTGLGLSIAKEFIDLHGGGITVADRRGGQGSVFRVELPLRAPKGTEVRRDAAQPDSTSEPQLVEELGLCSPARPAPGLAPAGSPVVLVVEDNPDMNAFIARTLSARYHVVSAFDGHEGLSRALERTPDLILCDIMMAGMSGEQLVRAIRERPALDGVPIVLLTAKVDDDALRATLLRDGAQDYLNKPISAEHLLAKAGRLIADRRRVAEELHRTQAVSASLLRVHDQERKRIAEELHENIAQWLCGVQLTLSLAQRPDAAPSAEVRRILAEGLDLLRQSSESIRALCSVLHPALLDHCGLRAAMEGHVEDFARRTGLAVTLDIPENLGDLPAGYDLTLFRIMEEALTNVDRHSACAAVTVRLFHDGPDVLLEVIDEAPAGSVERTETFGREASSSAMHERARSVGGRLEVRAGTKGTSFRAVLPLDGGRSARGTSTRPDPSAPVDARADRAARARSPRPVSRVRRRSSHAR
jgi:PAS domain S-box-containing protein